MKKELTQEQAAVVYAEPGDLFVAAGAGSGKTHVLVSRFVAAILGEGPLDEHGVDELLAITFTDKAAGELAERVRATLVRAGRPREARAVDQAWVSTIHGMCSRMLRRHAFDIGLDPRFGVCTGVQSAILMQEAFEGAARELFADSFGVETLVLDFGATAVFQAVTDTHGQLQSMGRSPGDVALCGIPTTRTLHEFAGDLEGIADACTALPPTKTTARNAGIARRVAAALRTLTATEGLADRARALLSEAGSENLRKTGSAEVKELAEEGNEQLGKLAGVLTQIVCAPYEAAFARLLERFGERYAALKDAQGLLDFEDLQLMTLRLLEESPDIAAGYRSAFRHVMIDEFQDTNVLQMQIARLLADGDLLTVGDDKQSIYRFRHADVSVFKKLEAEASNIRRLRANYRSHADVLNAVNTLFGADVLFGDDFTRLAPVRDEQDALPWSADEPRVRMMVLDGRDMRGDSKKDAEARALARHLAMLRRDRGIRQGDMAVLVRAMQNRAERIEQALRDEGFDVYVASGGTFFARPEVEDVLALLRVIDNPRDDGALMQVLASRLTGLSDEALHALSCLPAKRLWDSVSNEIPGCGLGDVDGALLERTVSTIGVLREERGRQSVARLIHDGCERLDYDLALFASGPGGPRAWANVLKLARMAGEFERGASGDLGGFIDHMATCATASPETQAALASEDVDAVRIMSIHSAKGLEFPVVVVADLGSTPPNYSPAVLLGRADDHRLAMKLPPAASPDDAAHETTAYSELRAAETAADDAESLRVLYVACTRAREALILCGSADPTKVAKDATGLGRLRLAAGLGEPLEGQEGTVLLGEGSAITLSIIQPDAPAIAECGSGVEADYDPAAFKRDTGAVAAPDTRPRSISYTGLAVYKACPYKFYASRIARLRTPEVVRTGVDPLLLGSAVHAALQFAATMPDAERLDDVARASRLDVAGRERLETAVRAFFESDVANDVLGDDRVIRECALAVPLGATMLSGSIDLVSWRGTTVTVVDYKTGAGDLAPDAAQERYRAQAECYALAALKAGATEVDVRFVELERECRETRYRYAPGDAERIETDILGILEKMERGEFPHRAEFAQEPCGDCPALGGICPINPRRGAFAGAGRTQR